MGTNRRTFIKHGAALATLAPAQLVSAQWLDSLANAQGASLADYGELAKQLAGNIILPTNPRYAAARLVWNSQHDNVFPAAVVQPTDVNDVAKVVQFARAFRLQLTVRSGAHSYAGFSTSSGLVLDLSRLDFLSTSDNHEKVRVGTGANLISTYRYLWNFRKAIPGGSCPTVGIAGLAQGGGIGMFSREYGLTLDRMLRARIVTADGKIQNLSPRDNPDLFWAIRGGGGGSFGVVTDFEFATVPVDAPVNSGTFYFPWTAAERTFMAYQEWLPTLPKSFNPVLILKNQTSSPGAKPEIYLAVSSRDTRDEFDREIRRFILTLGVRPTQATVLTQPFYVWEFDQHCASFTEDECAIQDKTRNGKVARWGVATYSNIMPKRWPSSAINVVIDALEKRQNDPILQPPGASSSDQMGRVFFEPVDGATAAVSPHETAFAHRRCFLNTQFQNRVPEGSSQELISYSNEWLNKMFRDLSPWRSGKSYVNYNNRRLEDWANAYYGSNLQNLKRVKALRDPSNFFSFEQSIKVQTHNE